MDRTDSRKLRIVSHNLGVPRAGGSRDRRSIRPRGCRFIYKSGRRGEIASLNERPRAISLAFENTYRRSACRYPDNTRPSAVLPLPLPLPLLLLLLVAELLLQRLRKPEKRKESELLAAILISLRDRQSGLHQLFQPLQSSLLDTITRYVTQQCQLSFFVNKNCRITLRASAECWPSHSQEIRSQTRARGHVVRASREHHRSVIEW